ncbi:MAG TPA: N-acetylmuramoyl-L-alanine amidase [Bacillales bacterium]|nr:N-acetylmuramoyl-L-alanine amidase [Bacillales bacterium]
MKIMLDAGHGYNTTGKRSPDGMREYEFSRKVAAFAKNVLETYENVTVYFAHSDTLDVPLTNRTNAANNLKVNAYVSIHANAYGETWNDAGGIETYTYTSKPKEATELAQKVQSHLITLTSLRNRGIKTANFHVLRETKMTAILVECGFMTNQKEAGLMRTEDFQKKCAEAIVKGIAEQYHLVEKVSKPPAQISGLYKVQVGVFQDLANAEELTKKLKSSGFDAFITFEQK